MYVEAQVVYSVNGVSSTTVNGESSAIKSTAEAVPLTPVTNVSTYTVAQRPSIDAISDAVPSLLTPVLIQTNTTSPTLLLNLNANGLEKEGFISVIVILTQDGTDDKPEGEQVILVFPSAGSTFSFDTAVNPISNDLTVAASDPRLIPGESVTAVPINIANTTISSDNNTYTLTIGSEKSDGRYGLSTLTMPPTADSKFLPDKVVNYMVMLTNRMGTDVEVGEFMYESIPSVKNVNIVIANGVYSVTFEIYSV
jgi:hypothetical protein